MWFPTMWQLDKRRPRRVCASPSSLQNYKRRSASSLTVIGHPSNGLRVYAGRSETSLVAHTTLLGIPCRGSFPCHLDYRGPRHTSGAQSLYSQYPWSLQRSILQKLKNQKKDVIVALNVITLCPVLPKTEQTATRFCI